MFKPDEIIKLYSFIESSFNLERFVYKNINMWPLVRAQIGFDLSFGRKNPVANQFKRKQTIGDLVKMPYRRTKLFSAKRKFFESVKSLKSDVQILAYPHTFFKDKIDDKLYSRYIDPYYEVLKSEYPSLNRMGFKEKEGEEYNFYYPNQENDLTCFRNYIELKNYLDSFSNYHKQEIERINTVFAELNEIVFEKFAIRPFNSALIIFFEELLNSKEYFDCLFGKSNVKIIFLDCFYDPFRMGMIASAKNFGIKVIEIQHGGAEDNVYVPYLKHDIDYSILPEYLWCWSESDRALMLRHNGDFKYLRPFIGGNMWLKKYLRNENKDQSSNFGDYFKDLRRKYEKIVLITLQPVFISDKVIEHVVLNAPQNYFFLVRYHPFNTDEEKENFKARLKSRDNFETDIAGQVSLFQLFKEVDFQLTHSSTTAMEALAFGLPTAICSEYGYDFYKDQINDGAIMFSTDSSAILNFIGKGKSVLNQEMVDYYGIKSDPVVALTNLKNVLNSCAA